MHEAFIIDEPSSSSSNFISNKYMKTSIYNTIALMITAMFTCTLLVATRKSRGLSSWLPKIGLSDGTKVCFYFNNFDWDLEHPANERKCYNVTLSLIGWAHTQNEPCYHELTREGQAMLCGLVHCQHSRDIDSLTMGLNCTRLTCGHIIALVTHLFMYPWSDDARLDTVPICICDMQYSVT